jgi:hypothetical protein
MNEDELKAALEALPGERVTPEYMLSRIKSVQYLPFPGSTFLVCRLVLDNGFSVIGEAACADPANFDEEMGKKIAYDRAFRQLWPLFGFLLVEKRFRAS